MYQSYTPASFHKKFSKLSYQEQTRIEIIYKQLRENPYVGDQLRYKFLREKRLDEKRIYYLVYDDLNAVLIVGISDKKTQKETINQIVNFFDDYRLYIEKLLKQN